MANNGAHLSCWTILPQSLGAGQLNFSTIGVFGDKVKASLLENLFFPRRPIIGAKRTDLPFDLEHCHGLIECCG